MVTVQCTYIYTYGILICIQRNQGYNLMSIFEPGNTRMADPVPRNGEHVIFIFFYLFSF